MLEHVTSLMAAMDARFGSLLAAANYAFEVQHADLKAAIAAEFKAMEAGLAAADLRYQQRFEAQTDALKAALTAQKEAAEAALAAAEKETTKAEAAADRRFDGVNEFREQLSDQAATFMPRSEAEQRMHALAEKIADMRTTLDTAGGQALGAATDRRLREAEDMLRGQGQHQASQGGRSAGLNASWVYALGGLGALGTVVSLLLVVTR